MRISKCVSRCLWKVRDYKGLPLHSLLWKIFFFQSYVFIIALADKSVKLRILIIYTFCFYSYRRRRVSVFFRMVSVFAVQPGSESSLSRNLVSLKAVKDSGRC